MTPFQASKLCKTEAEHAWIRRYSHAPATPGVSVQALLRSQRRGRGIDLSEINKELRDPATRSMDGHLKAVTVSGFFVVAAMLLGAPDTFILASFTIAGVLTFSFVARFCKGISR